jgi:hypothetical protein
MFYINLAIRQLHDNLFSVGFRYCESCVTLAGGYGCCHYLIQAARRPATRAGSNCHQMLTEVPISVMIITGMILI